MQTKSPSPINLTAGKVHTTRTTRQLNISSQCINRGSPKTHHPPSLYIRTHFRDRRLSLQRERVHGDHVGLASWNYQPHPHRTSLTRGWVSFHVVLTASDFVAIVMENVHYRGMATVLEFLLHSLDLDNAVCENSFLDEKSKLFTLVSLASFRL